ncbi:MAG: ABC transporter substrate-binding protein, partial [Pseudomonadota bacterium]
MSIFDNPFDSHSKLSCPCGRHKSLAEHQAAQTREVPAGEDDRLARVVDGAVVRALFPDDGARREFLRAVGAGTALAAISQFFPLAAAREAFAQAPKALEKTKLKVGFIPITCATPIIMAHPMGFYTRHGLEVEVIKTAGWAVIRDKSLNKEYDASHMLSPMPLAISLGVGSNPIPWTMPAVENINGQAIT